MEPVKEAAKDLTERVVVESDIDENSNSNDSSQYSNGPTG